MLRKLFCVLILSLLIGCASTDTNIVGGYHNNMSTGVEVKYQYFSVSINTDKKGKLITTEKRFSSTNENLPLSIVKLKLGMFIINPHKQEFEIWENLEFISLESNKTYLKHKKLRYQSELLPEELVFLNLPLVLEEPSQVIFSVDVLTSSGELLYNTNSVEYKLGSNKN